MSTADEIRLALSLYGDAKTVLRAQDPTEPTVIALNKAIDGLAEAGLLDECNEHCFEGNEALTMWVEALALVPFPVQRWVIPRYRLPSWDED